LHVHLRMPERIWTDPNLAGALWFAEYNPVFPENAGILAPSGINFTLMLSLDQPVNAQEKRKAAALGCGLFLFQSNPSQRPRRDLICFLTRLLTAALAGQCFLYPLFLARFEVEAMTLHFLNDVLLLDLPFEAAKRIFQ